MKVTMYEDTTDAGDSVLIADNGKVTFLRGQPKGAELVTAVLGATWSDMPVHVDAANSSKGAQLCTIEVNALGKDVSMAAKMGDAVLDALSMGIAKGAADAKIIADAKTPYLKAIALALLSIDKAAAMNKNLAAAERYLGASPPVVNLLVRTQEAHSYLATEAQVAVLDAVRDVVAQLQILAKGEPGHAHAGIVALLATMGIAIDSCPCCGDMHENAPGANTTQYAGKLHVPGSNSVN